MIILNGTIITSHECFMLRGVSVTTFQRSQAAEARNPKALPNAAAPAEEALPHAEGLTQEAQPWRMVTADSNRNSFRIFRAHGCTWMVYEWYTDVIDLLLNQYIILNGVCSFK